MRRDAHVGSMRMRPHWRSRSCVTASSWHSPLASSAASSVRLFPSSVFTDAANRTHPPSGATSAIASTTTATPGSSANR